MYLKRLELLGFKSFAQKTTLDFPVGVTAVVGPNGSGKSNIIDAIRWILGERDAKNIRAERSESLIFSGTGGRARAGMAQVTITFDNSTHFFPVDFNEVSIRRRVTRDGTSEYFLNDSAVRLRDIIDFFSKVRLGTKGFAIINQGNSDLFIKASPSERRVMLEEVLGLRQFQLKRHEADSKLVSTRINLDKVEALIEELLPHLRLLRRQTAKWEKHGTLEGELKELENQYFTLRLYELSHELSKVAPQLEKLEEETKKKNKELAEAQAELHAVEKSQPQGDTNFNAFKKQQTDILSRRSHIQKELGRLEAEMEFLLSRPKATVRETELLSAMKDVRRTIAEVLSSSDLVHVKKALKALADKLEEMLDGGAKEVSSRQKEIEKLKTQFTDELATLEKNLAELGDLEGKLALKMREFNTLFKKAYEAVEAKKGEIGVLENQKSRLNFDVERVEIKRKDLANQATQFGRSIHEFSAEGGSVSGGKVGADDMLALEKRMLKLRGELASIGEVDAALIKEAKEMELRYEFLSKQLEDLKKATTDLKALILQLTEKIHNEFTIALHKVNEEFTTYFRLMFNGGKAKLHLVKKPAVAETEDEAMAGEGAAEASEVVAEEEEPEFDEGGLEIDLTIPRKNIKGLDMLSGGERSLVSIAVLFALISVSPPPFLVLDEVDAALDENNTKRFANLIKSFSERTQFLLVTHNRATMEAASILYGVTMAEDGTSRLLSLKLDRDEIPGLVK